MSFVFIGLAVILNVLAHSLAKVSAMHDVSLMRFLLAPSLWGMALSFVASLVFWILALRGLPLSAAHPLFSSSAIIVQLVAMNVFSEKVSLLQLALITTGFGLIVFSAFLALKGT